MQLTSRQPTQPEPIDLPKLLTESGVKITITVDSQIDPAEISVVQEAVWPYDEEVLFLKPYEDGKLTIFDLVRILDRLGFPVEYRELP